MSSTPRHDEMVEAISASFGTTPITPDDVAPLSGDRIDAARSAARQTLDEAERAAQDAGHELDTARDEHAGLLAERERRAADLDALRQELTRNEERVEELATASAALEAEVATAEAELHGLDGRADQVHALRVHADRVVELTGTPLVGERATSLLGELTHVLDGAGGHLGDDSLAALAGWEAQLRDGTAPVAAAATELLTELDAIEEELRAVGGGDASAGPAVTAARDDVLACQAAVSELERQASTGVLGERARKAIEDAHARRVQLESQGRKADRREMDAAREAEDEALAHVGFDSMLDFRIVMSSTGVGTLAGKRREVAAARLEEATARLEHELETSRRRREDLAHRQQQLHRRALAIAGEDADPTDGEAVRSVLLRWVEVPEAVALAVRELGAVAEELQRSVAAARAALESRHAEQRTTAAELEDARAALERLRTEETEADGALASTTDRLGAARATLESAERRTELAAASVATAGAELERYAGRRYLDDDVADRRTALVHLLRERAATVADSEEERGLVLDDPLGDLDAEDALAVYAALDGIDWGVPVVYVTSRKELLVAASRTGGSLRCANGRKRVPRRRWMGRSRDLLDAVTV